jgi:hypothetical protein
MVNRLRRAPAEILRVETLRLLIEETRARYPGVWRELLAAVEEAGGEAEAIGEAVLRWAERYHLADERGLVVLAAWRLLAAEVPAMRRGQAAKVALVERLAGYAAAPRPIPIPTIWLAGWREGMTAAELRRLALEAAARAVDEAIERWRAAADEAGLAAEPEARSERVHAEWLVRHFVGGEPLATIATAAGGVDVRNVRAAVTALRRRAGLPARRRGRPRK